MGEGKMQDFHHGWAAMEKSNEQEHHSCSSNSTVSNGSSSISSSSSLDTADDASSSCSSSPNSAKSSLHDLSDLKSQLPIKRGLSKFYQGKSESFTSLATVMSIEDLPKKQKNPYNKMLKMKGNSKSYGGGLDNYKTQSHPKPTISKKLSRGSSFSSSPFLRQRSFARSPLVSDQQNN